MFNILNEKNKIILLFVLAAILGFSLFFIFQHRINSTALFIDSLAYKTIALNIVEHGDFSDPDQTSPNNFRAPIYPLWLAFIYLLLGSFKYAVPIGIVIFSFSAPLTYLIAKELFNNEKIAFLSGLLMALEPWAAFLAGTIMSEHLFMPIFLLSVYLFIRYLTQDSHIFLYWSAGLMGVCAITRPNALYLWPIFALFIFFKKNGFLKSLKIISLASLIFIIVIAPWLIRNKIVLDTWQITSVQGFSLYVVNFNTLQVYLGNFKSLDDGYIRAYKIAGDVSVASTKGSEILGKEALNGIKNHLFDYIKISAFSLPSFFISNSYSSLGYYLGLDEFKIQSHVIGLLKTQHFSEIWNKILNISWGERLLLLSGFFWPIISVLFLMGAAISLSGFKPINITIFILSIIFYFDIISHLMPELARFRIQVQPFIFMFASVGLIYFFNKINASIQKLRALRSR